MNDPPSLPLDQWADTKDTLHLYAPQDVRILSDEACHSPSAPDARATLDRGGCQLVYEVFPGARTKAQPANAAG